MSYEIHIALRYLKSRRSSGFISLNTYFSVGGVMIGVAALIIVLSVMNGFETEVRNRIVGTDAHVHLVKFHNAGIHGYNEITADLREAPRVVGATPFIYSKGMVVNKNYTDAIVVMGIDPLSADDVTDMTRNIIFGSASLDSAEAGNGTRYPGTVLGRYLADMLRVRLGDDIVIMSPRGISLGSMAPAPKMSRFTVTGIFETGMYEYDATMAYVSIPAAQKLFGMPEQVTGIGIKTDDVFNAGFIGKDLVERIGGYPFYSMSWIERHQNLFSWMTIEKWLMFIVLSLIILVAAFNIISTLIMVVMEKTTDIGILKSMGAKANSIMKIFVFQGMLVGLTGTLLGCGIGYLLCFLQDTYHFLSLPPDIYFISALPVEMKLLDFVMVISAALILCLVATIYPSRRAASLEPLETIRYLG